MSCSRCESRWVWYLGLNYKHTNKQTHIQTGRKKRDRPTDRQKNRHGGGPVRSSYTKSTISKLVGVCRLSVLAAMTTAAPPPTTKPPTNRWRPSPGNRFSWFTQKTWRHQSTDRSRRLSCAPSWPVATFTFTFTGAWEWRRRCICRRRKRSSVGKHCNSLETCGRISGPPLRWGRCHRREQDSAHLHRKWLQLMIGRGEHLSLGSSNHFHFFFYLMA